MPKVFFCYRREDSGHQAGRIFDHLAKQFGKDELFKDVDSIPLGVDYRRVLTEKVVQCDALLALIGDTWLTISDGTGPRLENPSDAVRIEIESALRRNIPVIPVLVGKASMPDAHQLPQALRELHFRQGLPVRPDPDFHNDIERLASGIRTVLEARSKAMVINPLPKLPPGDSLSFEAPKAPAPLRRGLASTIKEHSRHYLLTRARNSTAPYPETQNSLPARTTRTSIHLAILKSGTASSINEMSNIFLESLQRRLASRSVGLSLTEDRVEWDDPSRWAETVNRLMSRGGKSGPAFVVAVGTQAASALQSSLGPEFGMLPTLLLGVTYPGVSGLVDSEYCRCETRQIMCVRYGCGLDAVASMLHHRFFPGRKLCFVYRSGIPQDEMAHAELTTCRLAREGVLRFVRVERGLAAADVQDRETVYFSWYAFSRLVPENQSVTVKDRLTVSLMEDDVRDGVAAVGIGPDHVWIGSRGADLISDYAAAPAGSKPNWGCRDVAISPLIYWLHETVAREHGISFPPAVLSGAREIYV